MALWLWVLIVGYGLFIAAFAWGLAVSAGRSEREAGYKGSPDRLSEVEIRDWHAQRRRQP